MWEAFVARCFCSPKRKSKEKESVTITTKEPTTPTTHRCIGWVAAFTLLSWFGEFVHNRADLPLLSLLSPENTIPAMITGLLFLAWWLLPLKRTTHVTLLSWAWLNLIGGGILSVLPFPFWPYHPAQTVFHYAMHVLYGLAQLPLIVTLMRQKP
jgi:hypothetical protein